MKSDKAYRFEAFISDTAKTGSSLELFNLFVRAMDRFGYDRVIFSIPRDLDLPQDQNQIGLFHKYPEDWQKYYAEKNFALIDPILKAAAFYDDAFEWSTIEKAFPLTNRQTAFMRLGEEAGLNNGVGIPLRGQRAQIAGVALATSERNADHSNNLDLLNAYCTQFYVAFKRLNAVRSSVDLLQPLTFKETEVLKWVSAGKTDDEIALILGNSRSTVDTHLRRIFHKLDVTTRVGATVKAIMAGLICP